MNGHILLQSVQTYCTTFGIVCQDTGQKGRINIQVEPGSANASRYCERLRRDCERITFAGKLSTDFAAQECREQIERVIYAGGLVTLRATLQFLSGGRFLLSIGAGGQAEEHRAYGYEFPPDGVRVAQLEEALHIIKALWTEKQASFTGKYYHIVDAACEPKPEPVPPIMVGAFGPKMLRLTARHADEWNVSSAGPACYRRLAGEFERACAEVGRDPRTVRRSWSCCCACAPTQAEAQRLAGGRFSAANQEDDFGFVGTPGQVIEQMQGFINLGVDTFMLECGGFPRLTTLEMLIQEVIPALNE